MSHSAVPEKKKDPSKHSVVLQIPKRVHLKIYLRSCPETLPRKFRTKMGRRTAAQFKIIECLNEEASRGGRSKRSEVFLSSLPRANQRFSMPAKQPSITPLLFPSAEQFLTETLGDPGFGNTEAIFARISEFKAFTKCSPKLRTHEWR